jgi:D-alanyl-D-alanine carboxypeptidase
MNKPKKYVYSAIGSVVIILLLLVLLNTTHREASISTVQATSTIQSEREMGPFDLIEIEAKSAYVYDIVNKKVLYQKNPNLQLPLASLTKVMTALVASEISSTTATIQIDPKFLNADDNNGLIPHEKWTLKNLSDFSLVVSSNNGADVIASVMGSMLDSGDGNDAFIQRMNLEAKRLGLRQTYFLNGSGLDVTDSISGGYGSAKDVATLFETVLNRDPHLLEATTYPEIKVKSENQTHKATNTNKMVDIFPSVLASKTGFTDLAGGNLAVAFAVGPMHPIIAVVMNSTVDSRFEDMEKLVKATVASMPSND